MQKNDIFPYLKNIPHSDTHISMPVAGLMTAVLDRHNSIKRMKPDLKILKLPIETKHKDASSRITTCVGYLITIHNRLLEDKTSKEFMNEWLDWESMRIYVQILLDSFAILVPVFYGINPKYEGICPICQKTERENSVDSFNQLAQWINFHKIDDVFTKEYKTIRKKTGWYKLTNIDRGDYIHKRATPEIVPKGKVGSYTFHKTQIIRKNSNILEPAAINNTEDEVRLLLKSLFNFLAFSSNFFIDTLTAQGCVMSKEEEYMCSLVSESLKRFNETLFS